MQRLSQTLESRGRIGGRMEALEEVRDPTGSPTESNLNPQGLSESGPPTQSEHGLDLAMPPPHVQQMCILVFMMAPTTGTGVVSKFVACLWISFSYLGCLVCHQGEWMCLVLQ